jgi:ribosome maturation factor RimP
MNIEQNITSMAESLNLCVYDISTLKVDDETVYRISVVSNEIQDGKRRPVTLDECVDFSHLISPVLDLNPPLANEYRLEVGSAGIERKIVSLEQFKLSIGEMVSLMLKNKEKLAAKLVGVVDSSVVLDVDGANKEIEFKDISKARTYFEW